MVPRSPPNTKHPTRHFATATSRTVVFNLWASGELASVTIGRRRFSTDRQIDDYLSRLEQAGA